MLVGKHTAAILLPRVPEPMLLERRLSIPLGLTSASLGGLTTPSAVPLCPTAVFGGHDDGATVDGAPLLCTPDSNGSCLICCPFIRPPAPIRAVSNCISSVTFGVLCIALGDMDRGLREPKL